jgi:hypothetical protein
MFSGATTLKVGDVVSFFVGFNKWLTTEVTKTTQVQYTAFSKDPMKIIVTDNASSIAVSLVAFAVAILLT